MTYLVVGRASPLPKGLVAVTVPRWLWSWRQSAVVHGRKSARRRRLAGSIAFLPAVAILLVRTMPIPVSVTVSIPITLPFALPFAFATRLLLLVWLTVPVPLAVAYALPLAMAVAPSFSVPVAILVTFRVPRTPRTLLPCVALTFTTTVVTTISTALSFRPPFLTIRPPATARPTFHARVPRTWLARRRRRATSGARRWRDRQARDSARFYRWKWPFIHTFVRSAAAPSGLPELLSRHSLTRCYRRRHSVPRLRTSLLWGDGKARRLWCSARTTVGRRWARLLGYASDIPVSRSCRRS